MNAEQIRPMLIRAKKIQLHSGMEGFDSPEAYGIYRHIGGQPLGVTGRVFEPPDLNLFVDIVDQSVDECADFLDRDKYEYSEIDGGKKIRISIPGPKIEPRITTKGTIISSRLDFVTGFDGLTKTRLGLFFLNQWCGNGATRWEAGVNLAFKNTPGNQGKWALFCNEIVKALAGTREYEAFLNKAATVQYTQKDIDAFFKRVLGYSMTEYKELTTRKRNILDSINACVAIESQANGTNLYSLLGGVTRYTTHELADNLDGLLINTPASLNNDAHKAISELMYAN